jgi:hypothetical protein
MANEAEIAGRTKLIADAMFKANTTLRNVLNGLGQADRTIGAHLTDLQKLARTEGDVRHAEETAEWWGQNARASQDPDHMEQWNNADMHTRTVFNRTQVAAGELSSRIGDGQRVLAELGDNLDLSAGRLNQAREHLEMLNKLPEYAGSDQAAGLQVRIEHLQRATARAGAGIESTIESLEGARRSALQFESRSEQPGEFRHSQAVRSTSESARTDVNEARDTLRTTGNEIYEQRNNSGQAAQFGGKAFTSNQEAQELADAMRAGTNPPAQGAQGGERAPEQQAGDDSGNGVQDPRLRLMRDTPSSSPER